MRVLRKYGAGFLCMAGCVIAGCAGGPLPEKAAWPWEYAKDYGKNRTGDVITYRGNVAHFDEPPKAVKPVHPEALQPQPCETHPEVADSTAQLRNDGKPQAHVATKPRLDYEFEVRDVPVMLPTYLPGVVGSPSYNITAFNRGNAPVSVTVGLDSTTARALSTDSPLPVTAVIAPHADRVLVRVTPRNGENFRYRYSWSIGSYTANHNCPERYQLPFAPTVQALARVYDGSPSGFTRHSVLFHLQPGTSIRAARKGTVVRITTDTVEVLHDDSTIASYAQVGRVSQGVVTGKAVATGDSIGEVRKLPGIKEGFMQLTVWRPEPFRDTSSAAGSELYGFDLVSFPMEFCTSGLSECRVITEDQVVAGTKGKGSRKEGKRKVKK